MKVVAVIVTYNPLVQTLLDLCNKLALSNCDVVLVDNSENEEVKKIPFFEPNIRSIILGSNRGIAFAQNVGIKFAIDNAADVIVFFDQDSRIPSQFLQNLLAPVVIGAPVIVAPVFFDEKVGYEYPSFRFNSLGLLRRVYSHGAQFSYPVDVIISSGSAATKEVFERAGLMDEDFFIDFVDIEWSIRCRSHNIPIQIVPQAIMKHSIGEKSIELGIIKGFIHSPFRSYYKLRNPFLLLRKKGVPKLLAFKEIVAAIFHQSIYVFFVKDKREYLRACSSAIKDGVLGIRGKGII